ncbi:MAG: beta-galactosidase [Candidatus Liptonbacteria bacterium]
MKYRYWFKVVSRALLALIALTAIIVVILVIIFSLGGTKPAEKIFWGVNFSQKHASALGLDWKETYLAILDELGARHIRIASHWDLIEKEPDVFDFSDLDWQIDMAATRNAKIILAVGMKTPRWPECHLPQWAQNHDLVWVQNRVLKYLPAVMERYRSNQNIAAWQLENEPFFYFGDCPPLDPLFFEKEVALARQTDSLRKIMITDSGEFSSWFRAASLGDIVGVTLYREVYFHRLKKFLKFPMTPVFYRRKAQLVSLVYGKKVAAVEVQAEPWFQSYPLGAPNQNNLDFTLEKFRNNMEYARRTGLDEIYPWGAEWWYYQKSKLNNPEFWEEAEALFK